MPQAAFKGSKSAIPALRNLRGIGPAMLKDFEMLGIKSVDQLSRCDGAEMYERFQELTGTRQDPCVLDTFRCAVAQARNPRLPDEQKNWWYWSKLRKAAKPAR
jgi:hypothetical protein